jgi:hypothetical protein
VVLLGMPCRIPAIRQVYEMPPAYYDAADRTGHPVLVISVDAVVREAWIVTRTTKAHAKGAGAVPHPAQPDLDLRDFGWWKMARTMPVPYAAFSAPDVRHAGQLDAETWARVVRQMEGAGR